MATFLSAFPTRMLVSKRNEVRQGARFWFVCVLGDKGMAREGKPARQYYITPKFVH